MFKHASVNKVFRLVWSEARQAWIAVAESARGRGKRSSTQTRLREARIPSCRAYDDRQRTLASASTRI